MAIRTTFIGTQYVKDNSVILNNVDSKFIRPIIPLVMEIRLKPILGSNLYNKVITEIEANANSVGEWTGSTSNNYYTLLIDYIRPVTKQYTVYECLPYTNWKITGKAVSEESSEFTEPISLEKIQYMSSRILDAAKLLGEGLVKHLYANQTLYPEYLSGTGYDAIQPSTTDYTGSIFIPRPKYHSEYCTCDRCCEFR